MNVRRFLQRTRRRVRSLGRLALDHIQAIRFRGTAVHCPVCGGSFRHFIPHRGRAHAKCPRCGSLERTRLLWSVLDGESFKTARCIVHFAPERQLASHLRQRAERLYLGVDIKPTFDVQLDITRLPFAEGGADLVVCCHVLEHIPDDRTALREIARLLSPSGKALIQVPMVKSGDTDEDPTLPPLERTARFGQDDHMRLYGMDIVQRMVQSGMKVEVITGEHLPSSYGASDQKLFLCSRAPI